MIDHIGNYQRSAQQGLPIYRLTGGAGYVWAASWDQKGVGTLRFLTIDASAINAPISNGGAKADSGTVADRELVGQAPPTLTQENSERIRADAFAVENRKKIADERTAKPIGQALDSSSRAVDKARIEPLQATQADNSANWNALFKSQVDRCWQKPPEAPGAIQLEVAFMIRLKRDGTLEGVPAPKGTPATPYLRVYQESALRAIIDCQPYNLPAAYFNEWKSFEPNFVQGSRADAPPAMPAPGKLQTESVPAQQATPARKETNAGAGTAPASQSDSDTTARSVALKDYAIIGSVALFTTLVAILIAGARKRIVVFYDRTDFWLNVLAVFGPLALASLSSSLSSPLSEAARYLAVGMYVLLSVYNFSVALRSNSFLPVFLNLPVALLKQFLTTIILLFSVLQLSRVFGKDNTRSDRLMGGALLLGVLTLLGACVNGADVYETRPSISPPSDVPA
jgi:hypothetical protein